MSVQPIALLLPRRVSLPRKFLTSAMVVRIRISTLPCVPAYTPTFVVRARLGVSQSAVLLSYSMRRTQGIDRGKIWSASLQLFLQPFHVGEVAPHALPVVESSVHNGLSSDRCGGGGGLPLGQFILYVNNTMQSLIVHCIVLFQQQCTTNLCCLLFESYRTWICICVFYIF